MNDLELKLCPFCGGAAMLYEYEFHISGNGKLVIDCDTCGVEMVDSFLLPQHARKNSVDAKDKVKKRIVTRWNTRK